MFTVMKVVELPLIRAVSTRLLNGKRGIITSEMIEPEINAENIHFPHTSLVVLENTVNKGGGNCYRLEQIKPIATLCAKNSMSLHLDGARIFNALTFTGRRGRRLWQIFRRDFGLPVQRFGRTGWLRVFIEQKNH